ncbi:MAG: glycosyltransferase family 4 protein [Roseivirga sp.]|nr:glycosyltransferase family 4 protein [Roseivirga sp.]
MSELIAKPKVLFFGKVPPPYIGPAVATQIILNSRLKEHVDLVHFDTSHHKSIDELSSKSLKNVFFPFKLYLRLFRDIIRHSPDIVYIPSQQTHIGYLRDIPYVIITRLLGKKLVFHLRGGYFRNWYNKECGGFMKWIIRRVQAQLAGQIVLGENLIQLFEEVMSREKIYVIPNAADYVYPEVPRKSDKIKVLFLGNFIESKGIIDFISAAQLLKDQEKLSFLCAGNYMDEESKATIQQLEKETDQLTILGPVSGKAKFELLKSVDIFVFPTYYRNEGHPWVIVEALGAGLPVISTDHGAIIESVIDGSNGYIINPQSPQEIVDKILELANNEALRTSMSRASRSLYESTYREANIVENFARVFKDVNKK